MNELIQLGRETFEFGSRGLKRLNRRLLGKRNQVAQSQGAKSYKHAKELDAYDIMDDYTPIDANRKGRYRVYRKQGQLESPADIQEKISRKRMEGMQRAKGRKPARVKRQAMINKDLDPRKRKRKLKPILEGKEKFKRNSGGVRKVGKYMRDADDRIVGLA